MERLGWVKGGEGANREEGREGEEEEKGKGRGREWRDLCVYL